MKPKVILYILSLISVILFLTGVLLLNPFMFLGALSVFIVLLVYLIYLIQRDAKS